LPDRSAAACHFGLALKILQIDTDCVDKSLFCKEQTED
jgi:hypothetical protein